MQRIICCLLGGVSAFSLLGCASRIALRGSFNDYGEVYAETQNRQMLLNLARLHEHEPPYFFQLAQISASYTFSSQLGLGDSKEIGLTNNGATNFHLGTGSLSGTATQQPIFTLVPLAGDKFAQQLLQPIKPEVFYDLYEEGWPIDLLMRVLIEKIEISPNDGTQEGTGRPQDHVAAGGSDTPAAAISDQTEILVNNPWRAIDDRNDPINATPDGPKGYYDRFLRACALAREFQKHGLLYITTNDAKAPAGAKGSAEAQVDESQALAKLLKALTAALEKGGAGGDHGVAGTSGSGSSWSAGQPVNDLHFKIINNETTAKLCYALSLQPEYWGGDDPINRFNFLLFRGFDVQGVPQGAGPFQVRLIMRSLITVMSALANEGDGYRLFRKYYEGDGGGELAKHLSPQPRPPVLIDVSKEGADPKIPPVKEPYYWAPLPQLEDRPALDLVHDDAKPPGHIVAAVNFARHYYAVADPVTGPDEVPVTWNRDVFRLLVQLSFLTTTDPAAYSAPSLLQLH